MHSNSLICGGTCGGQHTSYCFARDLVVDLVRKDGRTFELMRDEWAVENDTYVDARRRLLMEWKTGSSADSMDWLLKETGIVRKECARRARFQEVKNVYREVDEMAKIEGLPGDIEGVQLSTQQAIRIQLADLESQGVLNKSNMPETLEYRFSFDGTVLSQGESLVVVAIVPTNLPISCQSSASAMPIALLKCGEDRELLRVALEKVLGDMARLQTRQSLTWHGPRHVIISHSYDMASWWKILSQAWNSNSGCCPWCTAYQHNLHEFDTWRKVELPTGVHPRSIIPIPMEHCMLFDNKRCTYFIPFHTYVLCIDVKTCKLKHAN